MSAVFISILGAMTACVDGGQVALGGRRQRAVLARLLLSRPRSVSVGHIVDDVWDGEAAPSLATLHAYIAGLRRALEPGRPARSPAQVLVTEGNGYALRLPSEAVDATVFQRLAGEGAEALRTGDPAGADSALTKALELWRGPAYADFSGLPFVAAEARRLELLRETARQDLFAARLDLGRHAELVGELAAYAEQHPLRERAWELLALGLYRSGRQADALDMIRRATALLADDLGLDVGRSLRDLEVAILRQDPSLDPPPPPAPVAAVARRASNLPFAVADFVGRAAERRALTAMLDQARLVTVTGSAGIGKTRLALEVANDRADLDGPWLVDLAGLAQPELVVATVTEVLGVKGAATADRLAEVLGSREITLIMDNCEHLIDAVREVCTTLLSRCNALRILATSRESLGITGEVVLEVPSLVPDDATTLFLSRAAALLPSWTPTAGDLATVRQICAEVDGVPLAIELAAAQCRVLSLTQIANSLDARAGSSFTGGTSGRHCSLDEAISWSYDLLPEPERQTFGRLSVFACGFDLEAAAAVAGDEAYPLSLLPAVSALVRKSLLRAEPGTTPRRYRMLTALRCFAANTLDAATSTALQARHRVWVLDWAEAAEPGLRGPDAAALMTRLNADQAETRAALVSALLAGDGETALRLCGALGWFWYRQGHLAEGLGWVRASLDLAPAAAPRLRGRALIAMAGLSYLGGDAVAALDAAKAAADLARTADDQLTEAHALIGQAHLAALLGDLDHGLGRAECGLELVRRGGPPWLHAEALMILGMLRRLAGQSAQALADLERAVEIAEGCGHLWAATSAAWAGMKCAIDSGDTDSALDRATRLLRPLEAEGDVTSWLVLAHTTAAALAHAGRAEEGAVLLGAVAAHGAKVGFSPELMDPIDGPREAAAVRASLLAESLARCLSEGAALTRAQVSDLIARSGLPA